VRRLLFYQVPSPDPKSYRFLKELDSLLKIDKIKFVKDFSNSDIDDYVICDNCYRKNEHCYAWYMNKLIDLNFGENYIFNQKEKADILYISKHLNDTFKFSDCDTVVRYGNSKSYSQQFEDKNKDLDEYIIYPKDFNYTNGGFFSYSTVYFIIGNDGKISDIETETSFKNKENYRFKSFFEKQLIEFVKKTKWKPATARGFKVKSRMSLTYHYK